MLSEDKNENLPEHEKREEDNEQLEKILQAGRVLAHPSPGEEVVITGMAGRFPESDDIYKYRENLMNKLDMVSNDDRRWKPAHLEIPHRSGKINFLEKVDAGFFGFSYHQAHQMDPQCRQVVERAFEAVLDAGYHPRELKGTRTGVFIGTCFSESELRLYYENLKSPAMGILGCLRSMQANWISYVLGLEGPSCSVDTACSSSLSALDYAYKAMRSGECDSALVGGTNLCLRPTITLQFARLGVLSSDGVCKSFDEDADGYARSETAAVIFLQKSKDARRIYAQVIHSKTNSDGYKEQGITFPSGPMQKQLLDEIYKECDVDPTTIDFLEAHSTGTKVGDPEEIMAMDEVFCVNRKTPLYVGSVKSNLGHTEPAAGLCSIVKVLLGMENDCLLPNNNFKRPREGAEALEEGRMVVVTDITPWPKNGSGCVAINSFGFGGSNCHVLLKRFIKNKFNKGQPKDDLSRLICVSGRTEDSITSILDDFVSRPLDAEFVRLFHEIFRTDIPGHPQRGYVVVSKTTELKRSLKRFDGEKLPLSLVLGGSSETLLTNGRDMFSIPLFAAAIQNIYNILLPTGVNVVEIISKTVPNNAADIIIASVAVQIALVNILKALEISFDYILAYSTGELVAAYADGVLTLEQTVLAAYSVGEAIRKLNDSKTSTMSYRIEEIKAKETRLALHNDLEIVGYHSEKSFTISGPSQTVTQFIETLKNKKINTNKVQGFYGLHSKYFTEIYPEILTRLQEIIPTPCQRSFKWIVTSGCRQLGNESTGNVSAEYFAEMFSNPIQFNAKIKTVLPKSVFLEIEQDSIGDKNYKHVHLMSGKNNKENYSDFFLSSLGSLYELGYNMKLDLLYPKVQWPVSNNTPMISPLIKWNHSEDWMTTKYEAQAKTKFGERVIFFTTKHAEWRFLRGHVIDGRNLVPATGYLYMVWETLAMMMGRFLAEVPVVFENVRFYKAMTFSQNDFTVLTILVNELTGTFEVRDISDTVVVGKIRIPEDVSQETVRLPVPVKEENPEPFTTKDIYKELKLRGYNYMGHFRGLRDFDLSAQRGSVEWTGNWITFMDNMLQLKILQEDTRCLYVPVGIERLAIDPTAHLLYVKEFGENPVLPVYANRETDIIKSGAIELRGLLASSIPRRLPRGELVLETHKFIPFETKLTLEQSVRVQVQIILENSYVIKFRAVELFDQANVEEATPLGSLVHAVLSEQPLIQPDIVVLSKKPFELTNVTVEQKALTSENGTCLLVIVSKIFSRPHIMEQAMDALKENGCIITREELDVDIVAAMTGIPDLEVLAAYQTDSEKLVLLRKSVNFESPAVLDISDSSNFDWLSTLKTKVKNDEKIILMAQKAPLNGLLGFFNCIRREPGGSNLQCIFAVDEEVPEFDINHDFYFKQLKKGLAVNIFRNGKWGTYRHLLLEKQALVQREHIFNNVLVRGDLSSLKWLEGPLTSTTIIPTERTLVHIYYSSLNFRDIMTATGRISVDATTRNRFEQIIVQGLEFAGREPSGKRVMGMVKSGALASMIYTDSYLTWEIPEKWSMEEASTIPVAYCTVLLALFGVGNMKHGESILIHAGSGGVGQAAINIALFYNCNIFTTVGTQEKRDYIRETFPQIPESHIGNSRDTSFEQMVFKETNGRGVDIVLNSLAEEKLLASVRCLAPGGRFLEIGKYDMASDNPVGLKLFTESRSFNGIALDVFMSKSPSSKRVICKLLDEGLASGMIKPINRTIFKEDEVEKAFRYMAAGKHTGKIVIKLREEEQEDEAVPEFKLYSGLPKFYGDAANSYIICGGLGGFGLELVDWLVIRYVQKVVLVSRSGLKNGYQASRLRTWRSYGVMIEISTADITTTEGCKAVINQANDLGPVEGIFNLAVVLKDALFENQNEENFTTSLAPKAVATQNLDTVSRKMCPQLRHFVVFSSVVCGRGNVGQTNYGMANSIMERICEQRKRDGYPALAIQWGAIGEVGLVAEMQELQTEIEIGGTLQQRITSCLEVMDTLLKQDEPIVSSIVVAEKKIGIGAENIIDAVKNILGIRDLKTISPHANLSELGMDSMMAVEIKQTLEREFEVFLSARDIRTMTFARLQEISDEKAARNETRTTKVDENEKLPEGIGLLLRYIGEEGHSTVPIMKLPSLVKEKSIAPKVFVVPGVEGIASIMEPLAANLSFHVLCTQFTYSDYPECDIEDIAKLLLPRVQENLQQNTPFTLIGYSYGAVVAIELAALLEAEGRMGRVILIDGAPAMFKELIRRELPETGYEPLLQTLTLCALMQLYLSLETVMQHKNNIFNCKTFEERVEMVLGLAPEGTPHSEEYRRRVCIASYHRVKSLLLYRPAFQKLKSAVKLFKPNRSTLENFDEDYKLQELCENPVEVSTFDGSHWSILKNPQVAYTINTIVDTSVGHFKQFFANEMTETKTLKEAAAKH